VKGYTVPETTDAFRGRRWNGTLFAASGGSPDAERAATEPYSAEVAVLRRERDAKIKQLVTGRASELETAAAQHAKQLQASLNRASLSRPRYTSIKTSESVTTVTGRPGGRALLLSRGISGFPRGPALLPYAHPDPLGIAPVRPAGPTRKSSSSRCGRAPGALLRAARQETVASASGCRLYIANSQQPRFASPCFRAERRRPRRLTSSPSCLLQSQSCTTKPRPCWAPPSSPADCS